MGKQEGMTNFFATQPNLVWTSESETQNTPELWPLQPGTQTLQTHHYSMVNGVTPKTVVPRIPIELILQQSEDEPKSKRRPAEDPVINIVTGGSFGRQIPSSPNTQRPAVSIGQPSTASKTCSGTAIERREFQRTLKKAIVSL